MKVVFSKTRVMLGDTAYVCEASLVADLKMFVKLLKPGEEWLRGILAKECKAIEDAVYSVRDEVVTY